MPPDLSPGKVAGRLSVLGASWTPSTEAEARSLLESARSQKPFAEAVAERLAELRALSELTHYLHSIARSTTPTRPA